MPGQSVSRRARIGATVLLAAVPFALSTMPSAQAASGSVTGAIWEDADRDGVRDAGETGLPGLGVYVMNLSTGALVAGAATDETGGFSIPVADGSYEVAISGGSWASLSSDWTPTTTGSLQPERVVTVSGGAVNADLGLRRIVRSTSTPMSTYTGPSGLTVEVYNDVVAARTLHDQLAASLLGGEAGSTTVRFDRDPTNHTSSSWSGSAGSYANYSSTVYASYTTWIDDGGASLTHEYGHAWSLYNTVIMQQDDTLAAYLRARGLEGDPRLGSDVYWQPRELVAEDYRQLFGTPNAASRPQANTAIPRAADVPGLREWMRDTFTQPASPAPAPTPSPTPSPEPAPTPLAVESLSASPVPVAESTTISATLSSSATVTLKVLDSRGRTVRTLLQSVSREAGGMSTVWDRRDDRKRRVKAGTYTVRLDATNTVGESASATASLRVV